MPDWDACANRHLLAHILKGASRKNYYCHPIDTQRGATSTPTAESIEMAKILRSYAHCWALDMEAWPTYPPTASEQRLSWEYAMQMADKDCKKLREPVIETPPDLPLPADNLLSDEDIPR